MLATQIVYQCKHSTPNACVCNLHVDLWKGIQEVRLVTIKF